LTAQLRICVVTDAGSYKSAAEVNHTRKCHGRDDSVGASSKKFGVQKGSNILELCAGGSAGAIDR
jgi:hypothetical protein